MKAVSGVIFCSHQNTSFSFEITSPIRHPELVEGSARMVHDATINSKSTLASVTLDLEGDDDRSGYHQLP